jgi:hypothetical protein
MEAEECVALFPCKVCHGTDRNKGAGRQTHPHVRGTSIVADIREFEARETKVFIFP